MNRNASLLTRLSRDESGNVMMLVGLYLSILIGVIGIGVNMGRSTILQGRAQNASDAAALAGALAEGVTNTQKEQIARRYFALNLPDRYLGTNMTAKSATVSFEGDKIIVDANHTRSAEMMRALDAGLTTARVNTHSAVSTLSKGSIIDMAMVMDASGSMNGQPAQDAFSAAAIVIDEVLRTTPQRGSRLAWVDYTTRGSNYTNAISSYPFSSSPTALDTYNRNYKNKIDPQGLGTTNGGDAMEITKRVMKDADTKKVRAVIYMTDGRNNTYQQSYSYDNDPRADNPAIDACNDMKNDGITIFTVGFGDQACTPGGSASRPLVECASTPDKFFCTQTGDEIRAAFREIVTVVRNIRISE